MAGQWFAEAPEAVATENIEIVQNPSPAFGFNVQVILALEPASEGVDGISACRHEDGPERPPHRGERVAEVLNRPPLAADVHVVCLASANYCGFH